MTTNGVNPLKLLKDSGYWESYKGSSFSATAMDALEVCWLKSSKPSCRVLGFNQG